jgi:hypothetical protein
MDTARFPYAEDMNIPPDYTATISKALGSFIQSNSATFACGGSIPVKVYLSVRHRSIPNTNSNSKTLMSPKLRLTQ